MASYWPSPAAMQNEPIVAQRMTALHKVVFSNSLKAASWDNTTLVGGDPADAMRAMKQASGDGMVILGSGTLIARLTRAHLIDEFQIVVVPVVLGGGRTMFDGVPDRPRLELASSRTFRNGNVVLCYRPLT
jgi:dihydrofolate reductase